jgi:hypothetical protein
MQPPRSQDLRTTKRPRHRQRNGHAKRQNICPILNKTIISVDSMNGDQLQALKRRLMSGDGEAQDLAWRLHRANDLDAMLLLEKHADIVAQHPAHEEIDEPDQATFEL